MSTTPDPKLEIRNATHHLTRAHYLLLDAIYEPPEARQVMLDTARQCCGRAEAEIE